jgi:hypothetical protein
MVMIAIATVIVAVPSQRPKAEEEATPDVVAPVAFGN